MSIYDHHIFVCINERPQGNPKGCCKSKGSEEVLEALKQEIKTRNLPLKVRVNKAGCLDQCAAGVVMVIYPQSTWYANVKKEDCKEIIDALALNQTVDRLLYKKQG